MTLIELRGEVRQELDDNGIDFYSEQDLTEFIQESYNYVAVTTGCIEKVATIDMKANLSYYKMTDYIPDWFSPFAGYNNITRRWLDPVVYELFEEQRENWEVARSSPFSFYPLSHEYVVLFPCLASDYTNGLTWLYSATADVLSDNSILQIPDQFETVVEHYALSIAYEDAEEFGKAAEWYNDFLAVNKRLKSFVQSRSLPDRLYRIWPMGQVSLL